jgi:microcystin degradation protein MlrC
MGPAFVVVAEGDAQAAEDVASALEASLLAARSQMRVELPDAATAVAQAIAERQRPVVLVDFGDNVGGGSAADGTVLLAELMKQNAERSVVTIADPEAVAACARAGVGAPIALSIGGKVDRLHGEPVAVSGVVRALSDGRWVEEEARHGGVRFNDQGPTAVIAWGNESLVCVTTRRYPPFSLGQLTSAGIDPRRQHILVVKAAIAYRAAYEPIAGRIIEVDTPGLTAANPRQFQYRRIRRPIWPLDDID